MNFEKIKFLATVFLVLACLTLNWANILTFNFTVICMNPKEPIIDDQQSASSNSSFSFDSAENSSESAESLENLTKIIEINGNNIFKEESNFDNSIPHYSFTASERSQAMSVVAAGALLANFPIVVLINWHGPRIPFALLGLIGAFVTAIIPFCLSQGFYWFLAARFLQGVAFAGDMATFGHFLANWTEHRHYAFLTASLALYVQLAPFFTFPAAGFLCNSSIGWPGVYYAHSIATAIFFALFGVFYQNRAFMPAQISPSGSDAELKDNEENGQNGINCEGEREERKRLEKLAKKNIPYREILTSKAAWAIFFSAIGDFTAVNLLYQFTPIYLYAVQGFKIMETGLMATLPPLVQAIMKELAGLINDRIPQTLISETTKTKIFSSVALFSTAGFLLALATIPKGHGYLALSLITAGEALLGFIVGGFYKSGPQLAGLYGPFLMGQVSTALTLTMLIVPFVVSQLTFDNTSGEWAAAFILVAVVAILGNIYYIIFAKAEPEEWATLEYFKKRMEKRNYSLNIMNFDGTKNGKK